ncbi:substrate-specific activator of APC-dependent proteolysis [Rhizopus stolonifer]|uniref:Substrate-specific activator of APC-dependent proteolysis n=1 Tax=Rhizopus stolonifer TaxID=4846 RepID=A0A367KAD2_RHIST|nr:substrate-specific activator of APC-dependent proteolysis [Rhizopus stolonifer]
MRLRSSRIDLDNHPILEDTTESQNQIYETESPKTPPGQNIEAYFPESPFGRKRYIIPQERRWSQDFTSEEQINEQDSAKPKKISAYFRSEILGNHHAGDEYISNTPDVEKNTSDASLPDRILSFHGSNDRTSSSLYYHPVESAESSSDSSSQANIFQSPNAPKFKNLPLSDMARRILANKEYKRYLNPSPIKTLDAPDIQDNFYLNLLDWGKNDCLAVALGSDVYLWNAYNSHVTQLCSLTDLVTSVKWSMGNYLAVGTRRGLVLLFDASREEKIRTWANHESRVSSLAWTSNVLSSGGRDCNIFHHDVRSYEPHFRTLKGHTHEVCGLQWNPEGTCLASGGNDNQLMIWDALENTTLHKFNQHTAAIKAISWSPHKRGLLVSGGGTADKTIKHWNTITGSLLSSYDTGSQVCNLIWSKKTNEIVSSHGYANPLVNESNNVYIWKTDEWKKTGILSGHRSRVLYMSMSYDESTIVTGAADESLMFWDIFSEDECISQEPKEKCSILR